MAHRCLGAPWTQTRSTSMPSHQRTDLALAVLTFRAWLAEQLRRVGDAGGGQPARWFPTHRSVHGDVVIAGHGLTPSDDASGEGPRCEKRSQLEVGRAIDLDLGLLHDDAWLRAAGKRQHRDRGAHTVYVEAEAARQLSTREVVPLIDRFCLLRCLRQPKTVQLEIARQWRR